MLFFEPKNSFNPLGLLLRGDLGFQKKQFVNLPQNVCFMKKVFFEFLFGDFFKRPNAFAVKGDSLKLLYYGDSLLVTGNGIKHSKLDSHDKKALEKKVKKKMGCTDTCDGSVYEISFPLNEPVFSLTVRTDPKDLKGYKPLQLDSSILPLESPGYKKLREYEESLKYRE